MVDEPDEVKPKTHSKGRKRRSPAGPTPAPPDSAGVSAPEGAASVEPSPVAPSAEAASGADLAQASPETSSPSADSIPAAEEGGPAEDLAPASPAQDSCLLDAADQGGEQAPSNDPAASGRTQTDREEPAAAGTEQDEEEENGGGPVKSFLEHLEDLRWTIIRCLAALLIAMVVCLIAGSKVVDLLREPLHRAQKLVKRKGEPFALLQLGTNRWVLDLDSNVFGPYQLGETGAIKLIISPVQVGTNVVLGLTPALLDKKEVPPINQVDLKNLGPISPFVVALKIALFGGLGLASPFILLFIGQFVIPALKRKEKKYLYQALAIGSLLFCAGVLFCYYFMLQIALNAAVQFSKWMGFSADIWRAEDYIGFVVKFLLGMGLSFELPVVLLTLVKLELLDYERMSRFRPLWIVLNLVLAAMLTPPDVVSQLLMAIPLQVLFELSVLIAWYWHRRDQKRQAVAP